MIKSFENTFLRKFCRPYHWLSLWESIKSVLVSTIASFRNTKRQPRRRQHEKTRIFMLQSDQETPKLSRVDKFGVVVKTRDEKYEIYIQCGPQKLETH